MAALGKIRSKGMILICIIGLGLFAFIAEEAFRSCESSRNDQRQQVGEVLGKKINVQEFQKLVDEYTEVIKMQQGQESLSEDQLNRIKDMAWNTFVQNTIIEHETAELGLTVTDAEMQNILTKGTNPMLMQTPFVNQETGRFDANVLKKFLADYKAQKASNPQIAQQYETVYRYWNFVEKSLRNQILVQKYQSLFSNCLLSNKIEAEMAFKAENEETQAEVASFPYSSIDDNKIQVSESDLKKKYDELKARYKQYVESRDVKYVDITVEASAKDRAELQKQFVEFGKNLAEAEDPTEAVRKSTSLIPYLGIPVGKDAYPYDIAQKLDSMAIGATSATIESKIDNTLNVFKLVSKQQLPDSIQFRLIHVGGNDLAEARNRADSIFTALQAGADFEAIAKKYGQTGEKNWITTKQYQGAPSMDNDTKTYIQNLNTLSLNETKNLALSQSNMILQVTDRRAMVNKYVAAVIKKRIDFSRDTYSAAYNKFSSFVSANQTLDDIVKNAQKSGYKVLERTDITTAEHTLAGIRGTRDALKWLFEAKEGSVSPLYECGENNHLLVVALNKINPIGYRSLNDESVKDFIKAEVIKEKKAEQLMEKAKGIKDMAAAKSKGATVTTINQITFSSPAFIASTGATEPALSGAMTAAGKGTFSKTAVKGQSGVYLYKVLNKTKRPGKFDQKAMEKRLHQKSLQYAGNFMNELYFKAKVVDNRYLFF
ncbi:MAG: peptidylprolyl isomerase [Prevotella sp.]